MRVCEGVKVPGSSIHVRNVMSMIFRWCRGKIYANYRLYAWRKKWIESLACCPLWHAEAYIRNSATPRFSNGDVICRGWILLSDVCIMTSILVPGSRIFCIWSPCTPTAFLVSCSRLQWQQLLTVRMAARWCFGSIFFWNTSCQMTPSHRLPFSYWAN